MSKKPPTKYDPSKIEKKWQKKWAKSKLYKTHESRAANHDSRKDTYYVLDMFPYPSGEGLHVGHPKGYIATDVISRMKRMQGHNVLHPMGFDAFGLPAENYAIKTKTNPDVSVKKNVARYKKQLEILGFDYDWSREVNTTDPAYYKWTQWIFLQLYKKGLAYESNEPVNWCPTDKTVLANEDVENGRCERCGTPIEKKPMRQWVLRITDYADRLLNDLDASDYVMPKLIDKVNPHQAGLPVVKRNVAHAIVFDPKNKKYLIIRNKKHGWDTVIIGGIEDGEAPEETARREVREETGYTDLEFKRILGGKTEAHYCAKHKGENRIAYAQAAYFELKSDARVPIGADEDKDDEVLWIDEKDFVPGKMVNSELPIWLERLNANVVTDQNTGVPCFIDWGNTSAAREGLPFAERNAIAAVVKHWKEDKYIGLKWKEVAWQTLITGGPEKGQTAREGAITEIIEETGYLHPKFVRGLGKTDSKFFHNPKNVNRYAHFDVMYFELADGERHDLSTDERAKHEVVWLTKDEMSDFLSPAAQRYMWDVLFLKKHDRFSPPKPLLDWPESIKEAQRNWIGRSEGAEIDFRLTIDKKKPRFVIIHGYKGSADTDFLPWLKREFEKLGHEVQVPQLPHPNEPTEAEQVEYVLKNCKLDENTVIIGHSLGAIVAMKAIMKYNKPVSGLLLVAAASAPDFAKKPRIYHEHFDWRFDYDRISKLAGGRVAILSDTQEEWRMPYLKDMAARLSAALIETKAVEKHFCAREEPMILECCTPKVKVFTTRPDTLFGVTYIVLAPEHHWIEGCMDRLENRSEVRAYIERTKTETAIAREDASKEKTGVELKGIKAVNPANNEEIPVWIADYVLPDYGTGAVMAVPAHDERDWEFAKKFGLPIKNVVVPTFGEPNPKAEKTDGSAVVVFDKKKRLYACLHWHDPDRFTIVTGGREGNETYEETAKRELAEEAGITKVISWHKLGEKLFCHYFNRSKNVFKSAMSVQYLAIVDSDDIGMPSKESHENFDVEWKSAEEILGLFRKTIPAALHMPEIFARGVLKTRELGLDAKTEISKFDFIKKVPFIEPGILINSGKFDGKDSDSIKKEITVSVGGKWVTKYKLRDWVFSRQRYWGEPIPLIHCAKCGVVPVPEKDLPVKLPKVKSYEPTGTGESPLAAIKNWVNVKCPQCKGPAKRETNTMPQWAGSCWYYIAYCISENLKSKALISKQISNPKLKNKIDYWLPVNLYVGGAEHATRHLIYARFWHKFLLDIGVVSTREPFTELRSVGLIIGEDGRKMSKRFGNVINPDDIVRIYGADTLRLYEMFMGPFDQSIAWSMVNIIGSRRFIERIWNLKHLIKDPAANPDPVGQTINKAVKKVSEDIASLKFNTAVSTLMITAHGIEKHGSISKKRYETVLKLVAPFAPHVTEELWMSLGNKGSIHAAPWPIYDPDLSGGEQATIIVQINGKTRVSFKAQSGLDDASLAKVALGLPETKKWLEGKAAKKTIVVPGRLVNIVLTE